MKITIKYDYSANQAFPFGAIAVVGDDHVYASGDSFEDAKKRLIEKLKLAKPEIPPPEEVEV